jgi:hypothetical protein
VRVRIYMYVYLGEIHFELVGWRCNGPLLSFQIQQSFGKRFVKVDLTKWKTKQLV